MIDSEIETFDESNKWLSVHIISWAYFYDKLISLCHTGDLRKHSSSFNINNHMKATINLADRDIDRVIEMAWEDRTPFEAIEAQFSMSEKDVISLMRKELKESSFKRWRKRVNQGVSKKHLNKRTSDIERFKCSRQKTISLNKISKR